MATTTHLTASMRVIRAHQQRGSLSIEYARKAVLDTAYLLETGADVPEAKALAEKLEKACECTIAELAKHAEHWPADA